MFNMNLCEEVIMSGVNAQCVSVLNASTCLISCVSPSCQILIHPGVVMDEIRVVEAAFSGGPLGELVQWSDLIAALHILGHHLHLSASISDVKR